ncbi:prepilin-type N-terminal cleavage/methylation domain-containing protein [Actinotalea sp. M2MS4P-6]|uniref:type IV pilus modification PilV family protein n=1 Tax=Actinotalea sp. M2MS4P-6 TaxID=2983762 RepID=UPI0021E423C0|nr:prepilin-type N-terminal cleavage/methylation domain-containing protein [Actinotalea sp. M2MS4P-6]MCV2394575.1 prepilin-type N-terminal cleavage/methylation domain-containing protein [Actinotalea sp. M2MS4P-6]
MQMVRDARRRLLAGDDAGVTLIEVVVATVILAIIASSVLGLVITAQKQSVSNRNRVAASNLAAREIELVREQFMATSSGPVDLANEGMVTNPHQFEGAGAGDPLVVDGTEYTVSRSSSWNITGTGESACEGGSLVTHPSLIVTVSVTWPGMGSVQPVSNSAVLAPERDVNPGTGASFAAVAVTNAAGEPSAGRTVRVYSTTESRAGMTDASGCAVIQLNPPVGGTTYTAAFPNPGYVDITGTENPERTIGLINPGELAASTRISLDRAGSVVIRVTGGVTDAEAAGSVVTLYQSEASGTSTRPITLTGVNTTVGNLWPSDYGAYFGTTLPTVLPAAISLAPGSTGTLDVPFEFAEFQVANLFTVAGLSTYEVRATPTGSGLTCDDPLAKTITPSAGRVVAGTWDFWLYSPQIGCSAGPSGVALSQGANADVEWSTAHLDVSNAPATDEIWVAPAQTGGTCSATSAVDVGPGPSGAIELYAGDWYVWSAPGGAAGTPCTAGSLVNVPFAGTASYAFTSALGNVEVRSLSRFYHTLLVSSAPPTTCSTTGTDAPSPIVLTPTASNVWEGSVPAGVWYFTAWDQAGTGACYSTGVNPVTIRTGYSYRILFDTAQVTEW